MKELKPIEETWNKKRIVGLIVIILVFLVGLFAFKAYFLDKNQEGLVENSSKSTAVKGANTLPNFSTKDNPVSDIKSNVQEQINELQKEAANLNIAEVASSSPQVQKVLEDLKSIQNLPKNQVKSFCEQICSGI